MSAKQGVDGNTVFVHAPWPQAREVFLAGDFNEWNPRNCPMAPAAGGEFHANLRLPPGEHHYKFVIDGRWESDPTAELLVASELGTVNSVVRVRYHRADAASATVTVRYRT